MSGGAAPRSGWRTFVVAAALAAAATAVVVVARGPAEASPASSDTAGALSAGAARTPAQASSPSPEQLAAGQQLYLTSCVSCHGAGGVGTPDGPSLLASGEASADFYLRTGRMPLAAPVPQPPSKPVAYTEDEIQALVAYVGSLCDTAVATCPPIPQLDAERTDLSQGSALFLANCAPCHNSAAVGGALSYGRHAPSLQHTPPVQVAEAIRVGPGQMPEFGRDVLSDQQVDAIVDYVEYLHRPEHPGGLPLGYTGPVAEGFVALLIGLGVLILAIRWVTRESDAPPRGPGSAAGPGGPDDRDGDAATSGTAGAGEGDESDESDESDGADGLDETVTA